MKPLPTPLADQFKNPAGFWYRVHPKCRRVPVLKVSNARDARIERRA